MIRLSDMVPGHKMCCLCFEYIPYEELYVDSTGQKWDMCQPCGVYQNVTKRLLDSGMTKDEVIKSMSILTAWAIRETMEP